MPVRSGPVPQMGDQVLELLQKIVTASLVKPLQVIPVPKISFGPHPTAFCGTSYSDGGAAGGSAN